MRVRVAYQLAKNCGCFGFARSGRKTSFSGNGSTGDEPMVAVCSLPMPSKRQSVAMAVLPFHCRYRRMTCLLPQLSFVISIRIRCPAPVLSGLSEGHGASLNKPPCLA